MMMVLRRCRAFFSSQTYSRQMWQAVLRLFGFLVLLARFVVECDVYSGLFCLPIVMAIAAEVSSDRQQLAAQELAPLGK